MKLNKIIFLLFALLASSVYDQDVYGQDAVNKSTFYCCQCELYVSEDGICFKDEILQSKCDCSCHDTRKLGDYDFGKFDDLEKGGTLSKRRCCRCVKYNREDFEFRHPMLPHSSYGEVCCNLHLSENQIGIHRICNCRCHQEYYYKNREYPDFHEMRTDKFEFDRSTEPPNRSIDGFQETEVRY